MQTPLPALATFQNMHATIVTILFCARGNFDYAFREKRVSRVRLAMRATQISLESIARANLLQAI